MGQGSFSSSSFFLLLPKFLKVQNKTTTIKKMWKHIEENQKKN